MCRNLIVAYRGDREEFSCSAATHVNAAHIHAHSHASTHRPTELLRSAHQTWHILVDKNPAGGTLLGPIPHLRFKRRSPACVCNMHTRQLCRDARCALPGPSQTGPLRRKWGKQDVRSLRGITFGLKRGKGKS